MDITSKVENTKRELEEMKKQAIADAVAKGDEGKPEAAPLEKEDQELKETDKKEDSKLRYTDELEEAKVIEPIEKKPDDNFKKQYDVLKSKYDKEVPRVYAELKELKEQNKGLQATIENMNVLIKELSVSKKDDLNKKENIADKVSRYSKLNPEDFAEYDDGFLKIVNTLNSVIEDADRLTAENTKLKGENESLKSEFGSIKDTATKASETVYKTTERSFWGSVNKSAPNFQKYNGDENGSGADPRWVNFLDSYERGSGKQLRAIAMTAIQNLDADTLVEITNKFESLIEEKKPDNKSTLASRELPGRGTGTEVSGKESIKPVTLDDLNKAERMMYAGSITPKQYRDLLDRYKKTNG